MFSRIKANNFVPVAQARSYCRNYWLIQNLFSISNFYVGLVFNDLVILAVGCPVVDFHPGNIAQIPGSFPNCILDRILPVLFGFPYDFRDFDLHCITPFKNVRRKICANRYLLLSGYIFCYGRIFMQEDFST